jgi:hypothetical protein
LRPDNAGCANGGLRRLLRDNEVVRAVEAESDALSSNNGECSTLDHFHCTAGAISSGRGYGKFAKTRHIPAGYSAGFTASSGGALHVSHLIHGR